MGLGLFERLCLAAIVFLLVAGVVKLGDYRLALTEVAQRCR